MTVRFSVPFHSKIPWRIDSTLYLYALIYPFETLQLSFNLQCSTATALDKFLKDLHIIKPYSQFVIIILLFC